MTHALIGHTGFVGGNLARQHAFDAVFHSANVDEMRGRTFDLVVCAGVRAEKWKANADPAADAAGIARLEAVLDDVTATRFVLVSTVDVFAHPAGVDEDTPVDTASVQAYGRNRRALEEYAARRFDSTIVRLPGLYGPGLKKNIIYDLLHTHEVHKIDARGVFQFYGVGRLWTDIEVMLAARLPVVHLPPEPVSVADVARVAFGIEFTNQLAAPPARYDVRTKHDALFGGRDGYVEDRQRVLHGIRDFVSAERRA